MSPSRRGGGGRGERPVVPKAEFQSYYGMPVLNQPTWKAPDIAGYLFLGGLAGASSLLAAGAQLTGRPSLARTSKLGALGAISLGAVGLVHDLGRPERFLNMLRVFKPTSPMSVGSWLLAVYGPNAGLAALSDLTGLAPRIGAAATAGAALVGPGVATYTAALIADTAVPAWHEPFRELPFLFAGSSAQAAGGLGLLAAPLAQSSPARRLATVGTAVELAASQRIERGHGLVVEPYHQGRSGALVRAGAACGIAGTALAWTGRRSRLASATAGALLLAASAFTRFGIFAAGVASAQDPKYTVVPQRERVEARKQASLAAR